MNKHNKLFWTDKRQSSFLMTNGSLYSFDKVQKEEEKLMSGGLLE